MNTNPLTPQELEKYLDGKLIPEEKYRIEKKLSESDFETDAIEGYENNPEAIKNISKIKKSFRAKFPVKQGFISIAVVTVFSLSLIFFAITYFLPGNDPVNQEKIQVAENKSTEKSQVIEQIKSDLEIEDSQPIAIPEQITYKKTVDNQVKPVEKSTNPEKMQIQDPETLRVESSSPELNIIINEITNCETDYIHDLKVVDYSRIYKTLIKKYRYDLGGIEARYQNNESERNTYVPDYEVELIPYRDFLSIALGNFVQNNFKDALKDLSIISTQFPNDQNANFYSGLCYYNLGKWNKAIKAFDETIKHQINVFDQEALWYKAMTLIKKKENDGAIEILEQIIRKKGFYASQAETVLEKLK